MTMVGKWQQTSSVVAMLPLLLLFAFLAVAATAQQLDVGVYISRTGTFNGIEQAHDGIVTWADYVNQRYGGIVLPNGTTARVNLIVRDDESNITLAREIWQQFADMGLRYVIGGHTSMTIPASEFFEPRGIVNIHCCTGPDAVYTTNPKRWVLGIHRSSLDYPKGLIRQLSLRGITKIAIVYNTVSGFTISTADSAESFARIVGLEVVEKLEFDGTGYRNLTHAPGGPQLRAAVDRIAARVRNGTRLALFGITLGNDGNDFARYVDELQLGVEALFITVAPTTEAFVPAVGRRAAEYVYSPLQWHNSFRFDDPLFGSSAEYQRVFREHHNYTATYTTASGTAAGVALHLGVQSAGTLEPNAVIQALRELRRDTFFGPMAFNRYQRNYGGATGTIQVLDGRLQSVLPDVSAEALSVLPMPQPSARAQCPAESPGHTNFTSCQARLAAAAANSGGGDNSSTVVVAVVVPIVIVAIVLSIILGGRAAQAAGKARNVENAPKDGRITLMFTDVQDSTKLWSTCPMSMSIALDTHHAVIREAINTHKCYEVKTAGDSFMIACPSEDAALALALAIQRNLLRQAYPAAIDAVYAAATDDELLAVDDAPDLVVTGGEVWGGLRVRIGFHSGTPQVQFDDVAKGYDYYGPPVNVAARVESVTKGGQVCCSKGTAEHFAAALRTGGDFEVRGLGFFELKGVAEPTEIVEIMPAEFVGKRVFKNEKDAIQDENEHLDGLDDTASTATLAVDGDTLDTVTNTVATMLRIMRPADREKTLKGIMAAWRLPWLPTSVDDNVAALGRRLAKAYRPVVRAASSSSSRGSFSVQKNTARGVSATTPKNSRAKYATATSPREGAEEGGSHPNEVVTQP